MSLNISEYLKKIKKVYNRKKYIRSVRKKHACEIKEIEEQYGVDFGGYIPNVSDLGTDSAYCNGYEASYHMPEIISSLHIEESDRILDVGSGKGYAMYMFSQLPFSKIHGVELSETLVEISKNNLKKLFPDDNRFQIFKENALSFSRYDDYNYIYLYNPFPREVIGEFADVLKQSVLRRDDKLTVIYQNPQKGALFEASGVFKTVCIKDGTAIFESVK